jgi:hypothetical protein
MSPNTQFWKSLAIPAISAIFSQLQDHQVAKAEIN